MPWPCWGVSIRSLLSKDLSVVRDALGLLRLRASFAAGCCVNVFRQNGRDAFVGCRNSFYVTRIRQMSVLQMALLDCRRQENPPRKDGKEDHDATVPMPWMLIADFNLQTTTQSHTQTHTHTHRDTDRHTTDIMARFGWQQLQQPIEPAPLMPEVAFVLLPPQKDDLSSVYRCSRAGLV